ncbi:MAG: ATP-binding protein [Acidimicrobiales bacterium]
MKIEEQLQTAKSRRWRRLSLRARLSLGLVIVTAVGLVVADVIVYGQIESYLSGQVDSELQTTLHVVTQELGASPFRQFNFSEATPNGTFGAFVNSSGVVLQTPSNQLLSGSPVLPSWVDAAPSSNVTRYFTTPATGDSAFHYRVLAQSACLNCTLGPGQPGFAVVAVPLTSLDATLSRLTTVDIAVSAVVLAVLALIGYVVVRLGMRPLEEIERTARAIAAGDLTKRVERDDDRTEVGRLGRSLNEMLATIELAFSEQQASENRLRQFLADASHELRTPITSIRGYSELFRRGAASRPDDLASSMRRIEDEATRMGVLVDDLLLLARLDQGRPLEQNPVDLVAIAVKAAQEAEVVEPTRTVTIEASEPVVVLGDEQRLRQVASNLIRNAIEHTPDGTAIYVSVISSNGTARLAVQDEGPGVPEQHRERIFERFYRADASRTRDSGGAGLGLSIVSSIVTAHGGRAYLDSDGGPGATFVVEIPLADVPDPKDVVVGSADQTLLEVGENSALFDESHPISDRK